MDRSTGHPRAARVGPAQSRPGPRGHDRLRWTRQQVADDQVSSTELQHAPASRAVQRVAAQECWGKRSNPPSSIPEYLELRATHSQLPYIPRIRHPVGAHTDLAGISISRGRSAIVRMQTEGWTHCGHPSRADDHASAKIIAERCCTTRGVVGCPSTALSVAPAMQVSLPSKRHPTNHRSTKRPLDSGHCH